MLLNISKKNKFLLVLILPLILVGGIFFIIFSGKENDNTDIQDGTNEQTQFESLEQEEEIEHNLKMTIIGPEGEEFEVGQARMYQALIEGNGKYKSNRVNCHWDFYLNENNEEVLYQQMDTSTILSEQSDKVCTFTSTFIEKAGKLRVVLTATIGDYQNPELEIINAEREYTVK